MNSEYEMSEEVRSLEQQLDCATEFCRQYQIENKQLKERVKELESQPAQEPVSSNERVKQESWISVEERLPEVKHEDYEFVLVAVDSAHTGKTHVFEAAYLNQVEVMTEDGNYISFTGWHTRTEHPDYDGWYESIGKNGDDRVVTHWMVKPLPPVSRSDEQPVKGVTE